MVSRKVTFTFDEATLARLAEAARRLDRPKSQVVREAIHDYAARVGRLSEQERLRMLRVFDEVVPRIARGPASRVDAEIRAIREERQSGGRRRGPERGSRGRGA